MSRRLVVCTADINTATTPMLDVGRVVKIGVLMSAFLSEMMPISRLTAQDSRHQNDSPTRPTCPLERDCLAGLRDGAVKHLCRCGHSLDWHPIRDGGLSWCVWCPDCAAFMPWKEKR